MFRLPSKNCKFPPPEKVDIDGDWCVATRFSDVFKLTDEIFEVFELFPIQKDFYFQKFPRIWASRWIRSVCEDAYSDYAEDYGSFIDLFIIFIWLIFKNFNKNFQALLSGTLPSFGSVLTNFASPEMRVDNWLKQTREKGMRFWFFRELFGQLYF